MFLAVTGTQNDFAKDVLCANHCVCLRCNSSFTFCFHCPYSYPVKVSISDVKNEWRSELGPAHERTIAEHYGIYKLVTELENVVCTTTV